MPLHLNNASGNQPLLGDESTREDLPAYCATPAARHAVREARDNNDRPHVDSRARRRSASKAAVQYLGCVNTVHSFIHSFLGRWANHDHLTNQSINQSLKGRWVNYDHLTNSLKVRQIHCSGHLLGPTKQESSSMNSQTNTMQSFIKSLVS